MTRISDWKPPMMTAAVAAAALCAALLAPTTAVASSDYSHAQYQLTLSFNCNDRTQCDGGFGEWGWIALVPDGSGTGGTGNAQMTVCGRGGGALHESYDPNWSYTTTPGVVADPNGMYIAIDGSPDGYVTPLTIPATYGHYSFAMGPISIQATVAP
jgi:anaerobic selenocysteine-containing dehydrogenase